MSELIRTLEYHAPTDTVIARTTQDHAQTLAENAALRAARPQFGKYKQNFAGLVPVARVDMAYLECMAAGQCCPSGIKYNWFSADREEVRRALLHLQSEHKAWLTVDGTPFAKKRVA